MASQDKKFDTTDPEDLAELKDAVLGFLGHLQEHLTAVTEGAKELFDRHGDELTVIEVIANDVAVIKMGCEGPLAIAENNARVLLGASDPVAKIEEANRKAEAIEEATTVLMNAILSAVDGDPADEANADSDGGGE